LKNPEQVDQIKADMLAKRFAYHEARGRVTGLHGPRGVYYVKDGHHRMVAAMEIYKETGDATPVLELIRWGKWDESDHRPIDRRPLPARDWWGAFRNWLGL
jgi:hypothetical protein